MGRGGGVSTPPPTNKTQQNSPKQQTLGPQNPRTQPHPPPPRQPNRPHNSIQRLSNPRATNPRHDNARDRSPSTTPHPRNTRTDRQTPDPNRLASSGTPPSTKDTTCFHSSFFIPTREKRRR